MADEVENYNLDGYSGTDILNLINTFNNYKDHFTIGRTLDNNGNPNAVDGTQVRLDNVIAPGLYRFVAGVTLVNGPENDSAWGPTGLIVEEFTDIDHNPPRHVLRQTIFKGTAGPKQTYVRHRNRDGSWQAWSYILTNRDVDSSLSVSGMAADAQAVGDLKEKYLNYVPHDKLYFGDIPTTTSRGITFSYNRETHKLTAAGSNTDTTASFINIYYNLSSLPASISPGDILHVEYKSQNIIGRIVFYNTIGETIYERYFKAENVDIPVPSDAVGMLYRYSVDAGTTNLNETVNIARAMSAPTNEQLDNKKRPLNIIVFGNSLSYSTLGYLPAVMAEFAPDIDLTLGIVYSAGSTIAMHITKFDNNTPEEKYSEYLSRRGKWTNTNNVTGKSALDRHIWDYVLIQGYVDFRNETYPYAFRSTQDMRSLMNKITDYINYPVAYLYNISSLRGANSTAYPEYYARFSNGEQRSNEMMKDLLVWTKKVLMETAIVDVIPCGTAVQNARQLSTFKTIGDPDPETGVEQGYLCHDNTSHLKNGSGPLISAYVACLKICELIGHEQKVFSGQFTPTDAYLSEVELYTRTLHGLCDNVTDAKKRFAAQCAVAAYKNPFEITNISNVANLDITDKIANIESNLIDNNSCDLLRLFATYKNETSRGITFAWDGTYSQCVVQGTAEGDSTTRATTDLYYNETELPTGIKNGKTYRVMYSASNTNVGLMIRFFASDGGSTNVSFIRNGEIEIPENCIGMRIFLFVVGGNTVDTVVSKIEILQGLTNSEIEHTLQRINSIDILKKYGTFESVTRNGITFDWQNGVCNISGTATSTANYNIYYDSLPDGMSIGDNFVVRCISNSSKIGIVYYFYDSNGTEIEHRSDNSADGLEFTVPDGADKWLMRVFVNSGVTIDGTLSKIVAFRITKARQMDVPLIVSFIDDDTTSDDFVTKFHDACCHNGVKGNFAVITKHIEDGHTSADKLLGYEDEGFGLLIHCYQQAGTPEWNTVPRTESMTNACRANLLKGIRQMRELGFTNYNYWVAPGGHHEPDLIEMAKQVGLECIMTIGDPIPNSMSGYDRWFIKRASLRYDDNGAASTSIAGIKSIIDDTVALGGGWLIITTHFNDGWNGLAWDSTLDSNGYPIGYSRFNEVTQYALSKGLTPMSIPQAWQYYKSILEANRMTCDEINAVD